MALYDISARLVLENVDSSSVERAISNINSRLEKGTRTARTFSEAVTLKGTNLAGYTVLGAAIARLGMIVGSATHDAIRFDQELAKLAQTVGVSNKDIREHAESIRNMSVAYGLSAPKIAETIRVLAQAGYSLREAKAAADELAKTTLLASFESISNTTEGLIAINKQFTETVGQSARVLSLLNVVAKKYAVESDDLVDAAKRAGGVFAATGGSLEQLVTIYTTVRDTTRESSETIATGLRTIFSRLQRPKTIDYLRQFGIELTDLRGNFIGNYEAILEIQKGIQRANINPGSLQFAEIVEQLGGVLQQSRVIPLLTQGAKMQRIYADAQNASSETAADLAKAQETLAFKLSQTQQNFAKLIGDIMDTTSFKAMISLVLSLTNGFIGFANSIKELIPLIAALGAIKLARSAFQVFPGGLGGTGTPIKRASGGFVPGIGNGDTVPAMLTPGEFVIRKSAAQALGAETLHGINRYAGGGRVSVEPNALTSSQLRKRIVKSDYTDKDFESGNAINDFDNINLRIIPKYFKGTPKMGNSAFEQFVARETNGEWTGKDPNYPVDVIKAPGIGPIEVRNRNKTTSPNELADKLIRYRIKNGENPLKNRNEKNEIDIGQITVAYNEAKVQKKRKASGGSISGTDTVPALLTPGEFVVNKKSAQAFGYGNLHKVNKYASGGVVGVQRFADGGAVSSIGSLGGLADLGILVNQLIPSMTNLAANFTELTLVTSVLKGGLSSTGSALAGAAVNYVKAKDEEAKKIEELEKAYVEAISTLNETAAEKATAQGDLDRAMGEINFQKDIRRGAADPNDVKASQQEQGDITAASKAARSSVAGVANQKLDASQRAQARSDLSSVMDRLRKQYGDQSEQVKEATAVIASMRHSIKNGKKEVNQAAKNIAIQAEAVKKYADLVDAGAVEQRELNETLKKQQSAAAKATEEAEAAVNAAKGGIRGKIKSTVSNLTDKGDKGEAARQTAQASLDAAQMALSGAIAFFVSQSQTAADELQKLSDKAVASGNAQEAYDKSLAASAKSEEAASLKSATTAGASIGAVIGTIGGSIAAFFFPPLIPLIPIFTSLGSIVGEAIGAVLGFTGVITYITDLLGITDSKNAGKEKADAAAKAAAITEADKITNTALTKSAEFRKTDPNKADAILVKGVSDLRNLVQGTDKAGLSISGKDIQDQARSLFDPLSASIEQLITKPENLGKSFDQLKLENSKLFKEWEYTGSIMKDGQEILKSQEASLRNTVTEQNKAADTARNLVLAQLEQMAIQNRINSSLASYDEAINKTKAVTDSYTRLLGGSGPKVDLGADLGDLSARNMKSPEYGEALKTVSNMGGQYRAEADKLMTRFNLTKDIATNLSSINYTDKREREKFAQDTRTTLTASNVDPKIIEAIVKTIEDGSDPQAIQDEIMKQFVEPTAKGLQEALKAEEELLTERVAFLEKQSEFDKKILELRSNALAGRQSIQETQRRIIGSDETIQSAEQEASIQRQNRIDRTSFQLAETRLAGANLQGGDGDLRQIGAALQKNLSRQAVLEDEIKSGNDNIGLRTELQGLVDESNRLKDAMSELGNVTQENAAIEDQIKRSQDNRRSVREAATSLAFGTRQDSKDFFKTLNQARVVAVTGSTQLIPEEERAGVLSFLDKFAKLPAFNGLTGKQVKDQATESFLRSMGANDNEVSLIMDEMIPYEEKMLQKITDNLGIDVDRNTILSNILKAQEGLVLGLQNLVRAVRGPRPQFLPEDAAIPLRVGGMANGGLADLGFTPRGVDTIPAMLAPGEFVVSAKNTKKNMGILNSINSGMTYASGGLFAGLDLKTLWKDIDWSETPYLTYPDESYRSVGVLSSEGQPNYEENRKKLEKKMEAEAKKSFLQKAIEAAELITNEQIAASKLKTKKYIEDKRKPAGVAQQALFEEEQSRNAKILDSMKETTKNKLSTEEEYRKKYFLDKENGAFLTAGTEAWFNAPSTADNAVAKLLLKNKSNKMQNVAPPAPQRSLRDESTIQRGLMREINESPTLSEEEREKRRDKLREQSAPAKRIERHESNDEWIAKLKRRHKAKVAAEERDKQSRDRAARKRQYRFNQQILPDGEIPEQFIEWQKDRFKMGGLTGDDMDKKLQYVGNWEDWLKRFNSAPAAPAALEIPPQANNNGLNGFMGRAGIFRQMPQLATSTSVPAQRMQDTFNLELLSGFSRDFSASVNQLVAMPKSFDITLASQGINVNLNGAQFLASLPTFLKSMILDTIKDEIGLIAQNVKQGLESGVIS